MWFLVLPVVAAELLTMLCSSYFPCGPSWTLFPPGRILLPMSGCFPPSSGRFPPVPLQEQALQLGITPVPQLRGQALHFLLSPPSFAPLECTGRTFGTTSDINVRILPNLAPSSSTLTSSRIEQEPLHSSIQIIQKMRRISAGFLPVLVALYLQQLVLLLHAAQKCNPPSGILPPSACASTTTFSSWALTVCMRTLFIHQASVNTRPHRTSFLPLKKRSMFCKMEQY